MTGRSTELPCVVSRKLFDGDRVYVGRRWLSFRRTVAFSPCWIAILWPCLGGMNPASAAAPPVPMSRPALVDRLEAQDLAAARAEPARTSSRIATRLGALSRLLAKAGLDVDRLVAEAPPAGGRLSEGEGGPLVPALGRGAGLAAERESAAQLDRLRRMQSVLRAMPLAAPMREYKLNSGFGYRRDPFRLGGALHTGLDFGGPRGAPVLATAPGRVVEAGRAGAYGIMVVVDHGMGIETRYAHLSRALVRVGDKVAAGKRVGTMGRTGRATGHHLHYEIRVDGRALNPKPFLEAGAKLRLAGGG
jgi:murein DD-endopeptidase MepM/ murein hydrolase activator NlpD